MVDLIPSEKHLTDAEAALKDLGTSYEATYGFHDDDVKYAFKSEKGLTREKVREISNMKHEPEWMTDLRLKAYDIFISKPMPTWGGGGALNDINFDDIYYYVRATNQTERDWDEVPPEIKDTFDRLGIPEAQRTWWAEVWEKLLAPLPNCNAVAQKP